jgi:hypothetical protein
VRCLRLIGLQELESRWDRVKKIGYLNASTWSHAVFAAMDYFTSVNRDFRARGRLRWAGLHREAGDTRDGRERFAAETKSGDAVEVGRNTNLTRRVTLQAE